MTRPLLSILFLASLVGFANAAQDTFVSVARTNWTPKALGFPQYDTNRVITNVVWTTNMEPSYEFEVRTNVMAVIETVGTTATGAGFPLGEIITSLIGAIIIAFVKWQQLRQKKLSKVLGQNIETYSEVTKAQPGGIALDAKVKAEIISQQVDADVKRMAAEVREEKVSPVEAKEAAERAMKPTPIRDGYVTGMSSPPTA